MDTSISTSGTSDISVQIQIEDITDVAQARMKLRDLQDVSSIETNIPERYLRVKRLDFEFKRQRTPFLLNDTYKINDIKSIEDFLKNDEDLIKAYFEMENYPKSCLHVNNYIKEKMTGNNISVELIAGEFYKEEFDPNFPYRYLIKHKLKFYETPLWAKVADASTPHWYLVAKVEKEGIINELIIDYAADQFAKGSIVPVVGPRDELRSIYVILGNRNPSIENTFVKKR